MEQATREQVAEIAGALMAAYNAHDIAQALPLYASDYTGEDTGAPSPQFGQEGVSQTMERIFAAFPDIYFNTDASIIAGNQAAIYWTATGTHLGPVMHIPATGKHIAVRGTSLLTIEGRQVKKALYIWDVAAMLRGIGLLPDL